MRKLYLVTPRGNSSISGVLPNRERITKPTTLELDEAIAEKIKKYGTVEEVTEPIKNVESKEIVDTKNATVDSIKPEEEQNNKKDQAIKETVKVDENLSTDAEEVNEEKSDADVSVETPDDSGQVKEEKAEVSEKVEDPAETSKAATSANKPKSVSYSNKKNTNAKKKANTQD